MTAKTTRFLSFTTVLALMLALVSLPAFAGKAPKVDVCHVTGSGKVLTLNISANALPAHLRHGDFLPQTFYADADGDGFGDAATSVEACGAPAGYVDNADDCDDTDAGTYLPDTFFADADSDGYGDAATSVEACEAPAGFVEDGTDCDDTDAAVNPGAEEVPGNGIDDDCNPDTPDETLTCVCADTFPNFADILSGALPVEFCAASSTQLDVRGANDRNIQVAIHSNLAFCVTDSGLGLIFTTAEEAQDCWELLQEVSAEQGEPCN